MQDNMYHFIGDVKELKWCFDHMLFNLSEEYYLNYLLLIASRNKKLSEEDREKYQITSTNNICRKEIIGATGKDNVWNFDIFLERLRKLECNKLGMLTPTGLSYPESTLVLLLQFNPTNELKVIQEALNFAQEAQSDIINATVKNKDKDLKENYQNLLKFSSKFKSLHAEGSSGTVEKHFIALDFDIRKDLIDNEDAVADAERTIWIASSNLLGKGNYFIIRTMGGFHVLVKRECLSTFSAKLRELSEEDLYNNFYGAINPIVAYENNIKENYGYTFSDEEIIKNQSLIPLPGCYQYGSFIPYVVNKEDFEEKV